MRPVVAPNRLSVVVVTRAAEGNGGWEWGLTN